jgi:hypothetical protein
MPAMDVVQVSVHNRFPPHEYTVHMRDQPPSVDCYVATWEVVFTYPKFEVKTYQITVFDVFGRSRALLACEGFFARLEGFDSALLKGFEYVQ